MRCIVNGRGALDCVGKSENVTSQITRTWVVLVCLFRVAGGVLALPVCLQQRLVYIHEGPVASLVAWAERFRLSRLQ